MTRKHNLDPLDRELIERAFESAWLAINGNEASSDEALEAALRRELLDIARYNGANDAETLRDLVLATISREGDVGP